MGSGRASLEDLFATAAADLSSASPFQPTEGDAEEVEDGETETYGYIIAKPEIRNSNSNRRVCFVYTVLNDTYRDEGGERKPNSRCVVLVHISTERRRKVYFF